MFSPFIIPLFPGGFFMSTELMNTKEVAQYLGINEKQVYVLIKARRLPSTRVTGKWLFPKRLIDEWIEAKAKEGLAWKEGRRSQRPEVLLASGSNDPVLEMVQTDLKKRHPELNLFSSNSGSTEGLKALDKGLTDVAWSHLLDVQSGQYNIPFLRSHLPNKKLVVVNLFHRELGFIVAPRNPLHIRGFEDLVRKGVRLVNRQKGSGTRVLLDSHLERRQIPVRSIAGYETEVCTHFEVGLSILSGQADVGIATRAISNLLGLSFIPITVERFDMVLDQGTFFEEGVRALLETLHTKGFQDRVSKLGYDFRDCGKILYAAS